MKKSFIALLLLVCCSFGLQAQNNFRQSVERPRLVVGIVVDQMRWDYLYRFSSRFGEGGFRRLMNEGFSCDNTHLNYIPTVTAIGHSSIYTGSVPAIHGIAGNNFYKDGTQVYCTDDHTVKGVGSDSPAGEMSPRNLLVTTMGDELKLATNFRSKVIGVALKDRASILPTGHTPDAAYWFDDKTGRFITSTYYRQSLPQWLDDFNRQDLARKYLLQDWNTLYPIDTYTESTADSTLYELPLVEGEAPTLPVPTADLFKQKGYTVIRTTPYGNSLTLELAKAALKGERLGQGTETDMLTVSLSSTDYVGHQFGTYAIETEDTYLRLDRDLADFFHALDETVGKGNYLVFLTADHAAAHNYRLMQDHGIPADGWYAGTVKDSLNAMLGKRFPSAQPLVKDIINYQVFFDKAYIRQAGIDFRAVKSCAVDFLEGYKQFAYVVDMEELSNATLPADVRERAINGYNRLRSGDIQLIMQPGYYSIDRPDKVGGTDHGVWNPYDAHIPLLFMGWHIKPGNTFHPVRMTDIAATVCALLRIQMPNGCIGTPVESIVE